MVTHTNINIYIYIIIYKKSISYLLVIHGTEWVNVHVGGYRCSSYLYSSIFNIVSYLR